jgi:hypothetical protein
MMPITGNCGLRALVLPGYSQVAQPSSSDAIGRDATILSALDTPERLPEQQYCRWAKPTVSRGSHMTIFSHVIALLGLAIATSDSVPVPPSIEKCEATLQRGSSLDAIAEEARCVAAETARMSAPGYVPNAAETAWLAEQHRQQSDAERKAAQHDFATIVAIVFFGVTAIAGAALSYRAGRQEPPNWRMVGTYLAVSIFMLAMLSEVIPDFAKGNQAFLNNLLLHAHWAAVLALLVYRRWIRAALLTGWGRLFVLAWAFWAGWLGLDPYENLPNIADDEVLRFTVGALLLPILLALAIRWVVGGFRHKPDTSATGQR